MEQGAGCRGFRVFIINLLNEKVSFCFKTGNLSFILTIITALLVQYVMMSLIRISLFFLGLIFLVEGCTYDVKKYYSESCKTDFTGFPDIPGWNYATVPIGASLKPYEVRQIYFFGEKNGIIISNDAIWLTEDEGINWGKVFSKSSLSFYDVSFSDELHGFISAIFDFEHYILITKNGGKS